ncbi:M16 family metallopeptidase [Undibacterium arcticum]|uniref:M16 family metallopeptidase n=1 Tax=Undibacterium arcticum TaxID=1762892 RepID=A0ABV7EZU0_9BURK
MLHSRKRSSTSILITGLLAAVFALSANLAAALALPKGVTQGPSVEGITEYRLANGLKVLLLPDASKPTVTVNVTYLVGSRFENYGETGMAHLLEHLMFKGAPKYTSIPQEFAKRGMTFNGTTSLDRTNYYEFFQAGDDNLKWAIEMEAGRMVHSFIAKKDLDSEMTVVRNEYEKGENSPFSVMQKRMQSVAFDWHSYGKPTIGNRSDIENVKIENLQAFYRMYYQPDNAVLLVAGKFDPVLTLQWIERAFGPIAKPKRRLPPLWTVEPTQDGERGFTVRRKGDLQIIEVAYKVPSGLHPDSDALSFAADILTDTPNGRLHKQLVESGKAVQVFSQSIGAFAPGLQVIGAVVKSGEPIEPVRDALIAAIEDFKNTPPTKEEIERVRRDYANQIEKMLNDHRQAGVALSEAIALGDWRLLFLSRDLQQKVTSAQVAAAAGLYFKRDNRTVGLFQPEDQPQRVTVPTAPGAAELLKDYQPKQQVASSEAFDPSQANIDARTQHAKIGGLELALLPKQNRGETVAVALRLHWGDEKSLFGKQTVASITDDMLMRGNSKFSREQLADEFAKLKLSGSPYRFETTRANLPAALRLVAQVLQQPSFPPAEFEQLRKQTLVGIESQRNEPETQASMAIGEHFNHYPKGDWRAFQSLDESIAELGKLTLDDVKAFHKDFYGASKGELAIVGDFDPAEISKIVEQSFGNWRSAAGYTRVPESYADIAPMRKNINTPDKENGVYTARVNLDLRDDDADYPALLVANYLIGGGAGMDSRLMQRIRQKDGLSYGVGSSLRAGSIDRNGSFAIQAIAAPRNLAKVDTAVQEELARLLKDGFSAEELARAKSGILQQRLQTRAQDGSLASAWVSNLYLDRTFAWSKALEDKIAALNVERVNAALRKALDPARMTVVIAGDEAKMKAAAMPANKIRVITANKIRVITANKI